MENLETYDLAKGISSEHLPIPHGGAKLFITSILSSLVSVFLELATGIPAVICVVISMTIWMMIWPMLFGQKFYTWIQVYWDRNVFGRRVEFVSPGTCYEEIVNSDVVYRVHTFQNRGLGYQNQSIVIPLGGWVKRAYIGQYYRPGWKVKKFDKSVNFGLLHVQVEDPRGDRVRLPITLAWKTLFHLPTGHNPTLADIVMCFRKDLLQYYDYWNNALKAAGTRYEIIVNAVHQIHESSRFGHSKEGRRVKEWMVDEVVKTLNVPDRRGEELQQQYKAKGAAVS